MFIRTPRSVVLLTGETCLLLTAVIAGTFMQLGPLAIPALSDGGGILRVILIVGVCQMCLHYADLYDLPRIQNVREFLVRLVLAVGATAAILALLYSWFPRWMIGPGVFLIAGILVISLVPSWRLTFAWLTSRVAPRERLLIVGTNPAAVEFARELNDRRHELGVEIVGFADSNVERIGRTVLGRVVGAVEDIPAMIRDTGADRIVVSLSDARGKLPMDQLLDIRLQTDVTFDHLASAYEEYTGRIALETLRPSWFVFSSGFRKTRLLLWGKRVLDVGLALVGLVLAAPFLLTGAVLVTLTSPGGALYRQGRVGLNGRVFTIYKLRTMRADAEVGTGPIWSTLNDPRVTPVGRFLRKTRLDELPQLWNVLRGDMSFVGPRPERPQFVTLLTATIPFFNQRHVLKPGITGWAQIRHSYAASVDDAKEKLQYDLYYIKNLSLWLDLLILVETVKTVVRQRGAR
ncbi:MAG TPA: TIGR03013 family XrtA/PEP-CTERM system glycosyltransferase [Vicinamibacterales bacterium]|nr:TIGR03013 family XrtA/PEP-CTERM system glycosyltransferase [Vicinamibacterales bacterium]